MAGKPDLKKICVELEKEIRKLHIKKIPLYEPPTPAGTGSSWRIFEFLPDGIRHTYKVDGNLKEDKIYPSLYEIFRTWWHPWMTISNLKKAVLWVREGKKGITMREKLLGPDIEEPEYDKIEVMR